uniref:Mini-chromosome maintenance complex-binding protein n=2 Tax=Schistocephalus solidus TaxID=70667 RepID=A0A0X3PFP2_SCHSO
METNEDAGKVVSCSSAKRHLPRVHAILVEKSSFANHPWLQVKWQTMGGWDSRDVLVAIRTRIIQFLCSVLSGDELTAEYLLLHLLSTSTTTGDSVFPMTLPPLNISQWEKKLGADTESLVQSLHCILPQVSLIPLTVESLNNGPLLMPVRDVAIDELDSGLLQLPPGSEVLVDETNMSSGQLTSRGVLNCRALTMLATQRKLTYDFQFYSQDWDSDVRVLILSTCASIIKPALTVPWKPASETTTPSQVTPSELDLWQIRRYLLEVQQTGKDYSIDPTLQEVVNRDFVNWRKEKSTFVEAEDFAVMLCLLKLYVQSCGECQPTEGHWRALVARETARRARLKDITVK